MGLQWRRSAKALGARLGLPTRLLLSVAGVVNLAAQAHAAAQPEPGSDSAEREHVPSSDDLNELDADILIQEQALARYTVYLALLEHEPVSNVLERMSGDPTCFSMLHKIGYFSSELTASLLRAWLKDMSASMQESINSKTPLSAELSEAFLKQAENKMRDEALRLATMDKDRLNAVFFEAVRDLETRDALELQLPRSWALEMLSNELGIPQAQIIAQEKQKALGTLHVRCGLLGLGYRVDPHGRHVLRVFVAPTYTSGNGLAQLPKRALVVEYPVKSDAPHLNLEQLMMYASDDVLYKAVNAGVVPFLPIRAQPVRRRCAQELWTLVERLTYKWWPNHLSPSAQAKAWNDYVRLKGLQDAAGVEVPRYISEARPLPEASQVLQLEELDIEATIMHAPIINDLVEGFRQVPMPLRRPAILYSLAFIAQRLEAELGENILPRPKDNYLQRKDNLTWGEWIRSFIPGTWEWTGAIRAQRVLSGSYCSPKDFIESIPSVFTSSGKAEVEATTESEIAENVAPEAFQLGALVAALRFASPALSRGAYVSTAGELLFPLAPEVAKDVTDMVTIPGLAGQQHVLARHLQGPQLSSITARTSTSKTTRGSSDRHDRKNLVTIHPDQILDSSYFDSAVLNLYSVSTHPATRNPSENCPPTKRRPGESSWSRCLVHSKYIFDPSAPLDLYDAYQRGKLEDYIHRKGRLPSSARLVHPDDTPIAVQMILREYERRNLSSFSRRSAIPARLVEPETGSAIEPQLQEGRSK